MTIISLLMLSLLCSASAVPYTTRKAVPSTPTKAPATIAAAAQATPQLSTLLTALKASSYLNLVSDPKTKATVFAPTNAAFAAALKALNLTAAQLVGNKKLLDTILSYHVVPGVAALSTGLKNGQEVGTALSKDAKLKVELPSKGGVRIAGAGSSANVVTANVKAGDSVIHLIDFVLLPPKSFIEAATAAPAPAPKNATTPTKTTPPANSTVPANTTAPVTIASVAASVKDLSTLVAAVSASNLVGAVTNPATVATVLAPTNEAFAKTLAALNLTAAQLLNNTKLLNAVLAQHVILGAAVESKALKNGATVETALKNSNLTVALDGGKVVFKAGGSNATVVIADVKAGNSIVHVIDNVLLPSSAALQAATA